MQKARVRFNEKTILNDGLIIDRSLISENEDDEKIYFAFFDDSDVALYSDKSKFVTKIKTDELERLIESGSVQVIP